MTMAASGQLAVLSALFSHWRRHKLQAVTLFIGLAAATALWTAVQALNAHARNSYDEAASAAANFQFASFTAIGGGRFSDSAFADFRRAGLMVTPVLEGRVSFEGRSFLLTGIDPLTFPNRGNSGSFVPEGGDLLAFLEAPGTLYISPATKTLAEAFILTLQPDERPRVRSVEGIAANRAIADIAVAQRLLGSAGQINKLMIPYALDGPDVRVPSPWDTQLQLQQPPASVDMAGLTDSFHLNLTAFGLLCFLVGLFIVYAAVGLAYEERRGSLRMLRICGVSRRRLLILMTLEMTLIAVVAGADGVMTGYFIAGMLLPDVAASVRGLYGASLDNVLHVGVDWWLGGIAISVAGALAASLNAFSRAARMSLLDRAGSAAWYHDQKRMLLKQCGFGVACLMVAAASYMVASGLEAAFTVMAGLLLGAAFLLPLLMVLLARLGATLSKTPLSRWFWADMTQQMSGLSLALMALFLALGTNIGVSGMVNGFRSTFVEFLDERLAATIYLSASGEQEGKAIARWLDARPDVSAVLPTWRAETRAENMPVAVTGLADHSIYRDNWRFLDASPSVWQDLKNPSSVLINEQLARRTGRWPGNRITFEGAHGLVHAQIVGVYSDYGNPRGEIRLSLAAFDHHFPRGDRRQYGVIADTSGAALINAMEQTFGPDSFQAIDQAGLKQYSMTIFEKTFTISGALSGLTLGVAGVAMLMSLLALTGARIGGTAPLWAMGIERTTLSRLELGRIMVLAFLTALAAIPLGVAISWCLVAVVNVEAFGWRLPLELFPGDWLRMVLLGLGAAFIAALYPAVTLFRTQASELAKVYAHDH